MSWQSSPLAPTCHVGRHGDLIIIRYSYAGTDRDVPVSGVAWHGLVEAIGHGEVGDADRLGEGWTQYPAGLFSRRAGHVRWAYGYLSTTEVRLPESIWQQMVAAIRARAYEHLPAVDAAELRSARTAGGETTPAVAGI
jgi:hypothetical protein